MSKSHSRHVKHDAMEDIAETLRAAADNLSEDAENAVAQAAKVLRQAAHDLVERAPADAKRLAQEAAQEARNLLDASGILNSKSGRKKHKFFVSDQPENFIRLGERFLKRKMGLVTKIA